MMKKAKTPILFLDFDGTIARRDVTDVLLEQYADAAWRVTEAAWREGRIGSRTCLAEQINLVRATRKQLNTLLDAIEIDRGLPDLLGLCIARNIPVHVISDGFDYCIERILKRAVNGHLSAIKSVSASRLDVNARPWRVDFPFFHQSCAHGCATCKPAVMRLVNSANGPAIFVGDGLSDRYAVECADLVFAKKELAGYCRDNSIEYTEYKNLSDVAAQVEAWITARMFRRDQEAREDLPISV